MTREPAILTTDSREQLPYRLDLHVSKFVDFEHRRAALPEGDYAAHLPDDDSPESTICIERKTLSDLLGSLTAGRERFVRELERLEPYGHRMLIIEASLFTLARPSALSHVHPASVIGSLLAFSQRYNIHTVFAGDRRYAQAFTFRACERWCRDRVAERVEVPA